MDQEYENILVPVDGSKQAEAALAKAVISAKRNGAHIDVLNVVDTRAMAYNFAGMSDGSIAYQLVDKATDYLKKLSRMMILTISISTFGLVTQRRSLRLIFLRIIRTTCW